MVSLFNEYQGLNKKLNIQMISLIIQQIMRPISYAYNKLDGVFIYQTKEQFFNNVESFWSFNFKNNLGLQICVALTYGKFQKNKYFFHLTDQRLYVQIINILKEINLRCPKNIRFKMDGGGTINTKILLNWECFSQQKGFLQSSIKKIKECIYLAISFLYPYLGLSPTREQKHKHKNSINNNMRFVKKIYQQYKNLRNSHQKNIISLTQQNYDLNYVARSIQMVTCGLNQINQVFDPNSKYSKKYIEQKIQQKNEVAQNVKEGVSYKIDKINSNKQSLVLGIQIKKKIDKCQAKFEGTHSTVQIRIYDYILSDTVHPQKTNNKIQQVISTGLLAHKTCKNNHISQNSIKSEIQFLMYIRDSKCSYIGRYFKQKQNNLQIYMKVYPSNLYDHLIKMNKQQIFVSSKKKLILLHQITEAIRFISSRNACHRDLKQPNIMMPKDMVPKVVDYGSVCSVYGHLQFKNYNKGLLATDGYYYPYQECSYQVKKNYSQSQYEQHIFFDSFSIGKITQNMFKQYERSPEWVSQVLIENIFYIVKSCKDQDPVNRLSYQQIQLFLEILYYK